MPVRSKSRSRGQVVKFGARTRRFKRRPSAKIVTGPTPNHRILRFRYALNKGDTHTLTSTSGSLEVLRYRANSCYDPYYETGGHQPYGFDQWMALFRNGVVLGSKITVTFSHANNDTANRPCRVAVVTSRDSTAPTGTDGAAQLVEAPRAQSRVIGPEGRTVTIKAFYSARKNAGAKDPVDEDDLHFGVGGDCTREYFYHICSMGLASQTESIYFTGFIDYVVKLFNPQILTPS